ncbi:hypothetical protein bthur0011_12670 [Bacillus thuringiensis serovar huazhongensis BGSC 4BD1]|nr:hypothetical protein bthur0011_12670 [Bacillus thuringiensis serovar huazhongensis BGSC 4BD1]
MFFLESQYVFWKIYLYTKISKVIFVVVKGMMNCKMGVKICGEL